MGRKSPRGRQRSEGTRADRGTPTPRGRTRDTRGATEREPGAAPSPLAEPRRQVVLLTPAHLCEINRELCATFGGVWSPPDNLRTPGGLEYLYDRLSNSIFGIQAPDDPLVVASLYLVAIAHGHPFNDGNKRTALLASWELLHANSIALSITGPDTEDLVLGVANGIITAGQAEKWLREHAEDEARL